MHASCTSLTLLDLSDNPLGVSGIQSLETAVQSGALINLWRLELSNTLTDDADVNGALLTTLLQSIASHCAQLISLDISENNIGLPGLCSVVENIPLGLNNIAIELRTTHLATSFHSVTHPNSLTVMDLNGSNFSGTAGTLLLAKFLQAFQSLEQLICWDCSLTSADIIMLIHHLKSANMNLNMTLLDLSNNSIDDEGVMALTECLPELFPSLNNLRFNDWYQSGVVLCVSEELILMCNEHLKVLTLVHDYVAFILIHRP